MRSTHNRAVLAARAAGATRSTPARTVAVNPALRLDTTQVRTGPIRRSRAVKMTATQRNDLGQHSEWNASMWFWTDPAWSLTRKTA
jgi:hypothetical protein